MAGALIASIIASDVAAAAARFFFLMCSLAFLSKFCATKTFRGQWSPHHSAYYIRPPPPDLERRTPAGAQQRSVLPGFRRDRRRADANSASLCKPLLSTCVTRATSPRLFGRHSPYRRHQRLFCLVLRSE